VLRPSDEMSTAEKDPLADEELAFPKKR